MGRRGRGESETTKLSLAFFPNVHNHVHEKTS